MTVPSPQRRQHQAHWAGKPFALVFLVCYGHSARSINIRPNQGRGRLGTLCQVGWVG